MRAHVQNLIIVHKLLTSVKDQVLEQPVQHAVGFGLLVLTSSQLRVLVHTWLQLTCWTTVVGTSSHLLYLQFVALHQFRSVVNWTWCTVRHLPSIFDCELVSLMYNHYVHPRWAEVSSFWNSTMHYHPSVEWLI